MTSREIIKKLRAMSDKNAVKMMARFGIDSKNALGITVPNLRKIAKSAGKNHELALELWGTGIHEARVLASMVAEPARTTRAQMDKWVKAFDSWDVCDQACDNLFQHTPYAYEKAFQWAGWEGEFARRAGFTMMAVLAWFGAGLKDREILRFLPVIKKYSSDSRNFVRKAVNWALRNIGKRNMAMNKAALKAAREMLKTGSKTARWIAKDAIRELTDRKIIKRIAVRRKRLNPKFTI